ncbi:hypothetical protein PRZ48_013556 [Zasmidium cellare]|uniref:Uncharacterized protein n=1 Tax=Zasmidium cellare TaxID=395010 RepID=A0ABR0E1D7_ZASCE|nr:hypothetical protein PRZ48_013556 [Zasmidium cellare]
MTSDETSVGADKLLAGMSISDSDTTTQAPAPFMPRDDDGNPFFGPAMSPAIFADKWNAKFRHFVTQYHLRPLQQGATDPAYMCILCLEGVEYIYQFQLQARQTGLGNNEYQERRPIPDDELPTLLPLAMRSADDELARWARNPVLEALAIIYLVDGFAFKLRKVKLGDSITGLRSWQELPLRWRQAMNEVFLKIEEGREAGWWFMPDNVRDQMEEEHEKQNRLVDLTDTTRN